jgi:sulfotransferase
MKFFFNSSLPRSGSTLLQNILGNNSEIYATPTSGLLDLLTASKRVYTLSPTFMAQDEAEMKIAFLQYSRFAMEGYFRGLTDKPYVIDKSRGWAVNYPYLSSFYPNPKIIIMVRDLRDIICSMERNYRKHPDKWHTGLDFENPVGTTLQERINVWMSPQCKPVGDTLNKLKEVFNHSYYKNILFVRYEDLCSNPDAVMRSVYKYLDIPYYAIDYTKVRQVTFEDDKFHGIYGDHIIHPHIKPIKSSALSMLGESICNQLYESNKWYFDFFKYKK